MKQAGAATVDFGRQITGQGNATAQQMEMVGKAALTMSGVSGAGLGLSAKAAIDWETAWAGVTKTVDGTASEMAVLEGQLRQLATELPATHSEIAAVAEAAGQLGISRENIVSFTRTMIDLGETTNLTAQEAATAMARMANIMQTPQAEIDRLGSSLVALGNNSATTEREILDMATRIASAGVQIGLTEGEVLGFAAALSSVGIEAEAGGTAISKVMIQTRNAVMDGGEALETFAMVAGMSADQFKTKFERDAGGAIIAFIEGLARLEAQGVNTNTILAELGFADVRVGNALRSAASAGDLFRESIELGNTAWEENTALTDEANKRYQTTAAQLGVLRNNIVDFAIEIGDVLLPVLNTGVGALQTMARGFSELPGPVKTGATWIGVLSTAGLGLIGTAATLAPRIKQLRDSLMAMGTAGQFVGRNMGTMATGIGVATVALGLLTYHMGRQAQQAAEAEARIQGFADAIKEVGDLTGGVEQQIINLLSSTDKGSRLIAEWMREAGVSTREFAEAITGTDEEWQAFLDSVGEGGSFLGEMLSQIRDEALIANDHLRTTADVVDDAGDASSDAAPKIDEAGGALEGVAGDAEEATSALEEYTNALKASIDPLFAAIDAFTSHQEARQAAIEAQRALNEAIAEHGPVSTEAIEAEQELYEAQVAAARSGLELQIQMNMLADAIRNGEVSVENATAALDSLVDQGIITREQANLLAGQFAHAAAEADRLAVDREFDIVAYDKASKVIEGVLSNINRIPQFVSTTLELQRKGFVTSGLQEQRWGGVVRSYQSGGIEAHIAKDETILYGERATGGEAFIPRLGQRSRSIAVLREAASWYGLALRPAGGIQPAPMTSITTAGTPQAQVGGTVIHNLHLSTIDSPRQWLDEASWRLVAA